MQLPLMILLEGLLATGALSKSNFLIGPLLLLVNLALAAALYAAVEEPTHKLLASKQRGK